MEEVLSIRLPKGTRRRLERRAKAQKLTVSQLVRRALATAGGAGAALIVSGDQDLLVIGRHSGIDIVSP